MTIGKPRWGLGSDLTRTETKASARAHAFNRPYGTKECHLQSLPSTEVLGYFQLPLRGTVPIDATPADANQSPRDAARSYHVGPAEPTYGRTTGGRAFRTDQAASQQSATTGIASGMRRAPKRGCRFRPHRPRAGGRGFENYPRPNQQTTFPLFSVRRLRRRTEKRGNWRVGHYWP
jgi:hypothetical protein